MGLGAYIHGSMSPPVLLGDPKFSAQYGKMLGFKFAIPPFKLLDIVRWQVLLPSLANLRAHPIGLQVNGEHLLKAKCPPYYASMRAAVEEVIASKFGPRGIYKDSAVFAQIYKSNLQMSIPRMRDTNAFVCLSRFTRLCRRLTSKATYRPGSRLDALKSANREPSRGGPFAHRFLLQMIYESPCRGCSLYLHGA